MRTRLDLLQCITIWIVALAVFSVSAVQGENNHCVLSLTLPRESVTNSCNLNDQLEKRLSSADGELSRLRQEMRDIRNKLTEQESKDSPQDSIQDLKRRVDTIQTFSIPSLDRRINNLEHRYHVTRPYSGARSSSQEELLSLLKPLIQREVTAMKDQIRLELQDSMTFQGDFQRKAQNAGLTRLALRENVYPKDTGSQSTAPSNLKGSRHRTFFSKSDPFEALDLEDIASERENDYFERTLKSLRRLSSGRNKGSSDPSPATDNEFPEQEEGEFIQSDRGHRGRLGQMVCDRQELEERVNSLLQEQTGKVKEILGQHVNRVNGRISSILEVLQGFKEYYAKMFMDVEETRQTDKQEVMQEIDHTKQQVRETKTKMDLLTVELKTIESEISSKFASAVQSWNVDLSSLKSQLQIVKRFQSVLESHIHGVKREIRDIFQNIAGNITILTEGLHQLNSTVSEDRDNADTVQRESELNRTIDFVKMLQMDWPQVQGNFTELQNGIDTTSQNIVIIQSDFDKLQHNHSLMELNLNTAKTRLHSLGNSMRVLQRYHFMKSLETFEWVKYNFNTSDSRTECSGGKFIKRTRFRTGRYVGVVLCSPTKYKIYLGDSITESFLDIGDTWRFGEDHCEFVGASTQNKIRVGPGHIAGRVLGYKRSNWGQTPILGTLSFYNPSPRWYECGVTIPG